MVAQEVDQSKNFLYFFNGTVQYAKTIDYKRPVFLGSASFRVDQDKQAVTNVKFYKNETGFFANTVNITGSNLFSERIRKGKINLYETAQTVYNPGTYNAGTGMFMGGGGSSTKLKYYYNKGFEDLKRANYTNLLVDLADNPESMKHMLEYKKVKNTQTGFIVAGSGLVLVGIIKFLSSSSNETNDTSSMSSSYDPYSTNSSSSSLSSGQTTGIALTLLGAGLNWIGYFTGLKKYDHLSNAIDAYNR